MTAENEIQNVTSLDRAQEFYARAYSRMSWCMLIVAAAAAPVLFWQFGWSLGVGFVLGAIAAFLNFHWLKRLVGWLAERVLHKPDNAGSARMIVIFILRYGLMALGAYAIFIISIPALYGFFAGLILPVAGVFCEAAFEVGHALGRAD